MRLIYSEALQKKMQ